MPHSLYVPEQVDEELWAVNYKPDDNPFAYVYAHDGQPPEDAEQRATILANIMNATVDMGVTDIVELLEAYEAHHGHKHHADWRDTE